MKRKIAGIFLAALMIAAGVLPVAGSLNDVIDSNMLIYPSAGQPIELTVGECDNFTLPTEPTYPSSELVSWIGEHYHDITDIKECDEDTENRYWAHTFNLAELCLDSEIEIATLDITVRNDHGNDHLKIGCITSNSDTWELNNGLENYVPLGSTGTVSLNLNSIPGLLDCMNTNKILDVAVDDDSPVDCAILTIWCREGPCQPAVCVEKRVMNSEGVWVEEIESCICENVRFNITVCNCGTCELSNIEVYDRLPECLEYVDGSSTWFEPSLTGSTLEWDFSSVIDSLAPNWCFAVEFEAHVVAAGENVNNGIVYADSTEGDLSDADTAIVNGIRCGGPCIEIDKHAEGQQGPLEVSCGDWINFTIDVHNCDVEEFESLVVTDFLPPYVEYVSGTASPSTGFSFDQNHNKLTWNVPISDLPGPSGHNYFTYSVNVVSCNCWNCTPENLARAEAVVGGISGIVDDSVIINVEDNSPPQVEITEPTPFPWSGYDFAFVWGSTPIKVIADDECRILDVQLTIDGSDMDFDTKGGPGNDYEWTWAEFMLFPTFCTIEVTARDTCFNSNTVTLLVLKWL